MFSSVQFSRSVVADSLWPHKSQHTSPPCPSPTPGVYLNSCSLSRWCHPTISSSVIPFSSCLQSFPTSVSFQMSQLFASGGQSIGVLALTSVLPMNTQDWPPLRWTGWISLQSTGLSKVSPSPQFKSINSLVLSFLYSPTLTSIHDIALTRRTFVGMTSHTSCLSVLQHQAPCWSCLRTFALPVASIQGTFPLKAPPGYFLCIF